MNQEDLINSLRQCGNHMHCTSSCIKLRTKAQFCRSELINDAADEIERLQAEVDELQSKWNGAEICGYNARNLIMFADACKEQHVTNEDLKKVATDLRWAVQTVYDAAKRAMENISFKMTENGCVASMKYIFPPPVNPDRLKDMDFKWDISGCKSVKISDIKYKEMQNNEPNRPD